MEHYAMYLRKSRADLEAEAHGEGETLARHEQLLTQLADKLHIHVEKIYREIVSGETISSRPVMQQLLCDVEQQIWSGVLVIEVERLARGDTIDQGIVARAFQYSRTSIITPLKTYRPWEEFDEEYFEFGLFMSRREYKTILRRMQNGRAASAHEGKYCGSVPPYGYARQKLASEKGYTLQILPEQAQVVRMMFDWAAFGSQEDADSSHLGASKIAQKLTQMQIPTPTGAAVWSIGSVLGILHNPIYCGKIRWGARAQVKAVRDGQIIRRRPRRNPQETFITQGRHPAIVENSVWELVQKNISRTAALPTPHDRSLKNPFAGVLFCAECGHALTRRSGQTPMLLCTHPACKNVGSRLDYVEDAVLQAITHCFKGYRFSAVESHSNGHGEQLVLLQNNLDRLQRRTERIFSMLESGVYTPDVFRERMQKNEQEIAALTQSIAKCRRLGAADQPTSCFTAEELVRLYRTTSPTQQNALLKLLFSRILYQKEKGGRKFQKQFTLSFYPALPFKEN